MPQEKPSKSPTMTSSRLLLAALCLALHTLSSQASIIVMDQILNPSSYNPAATLGINASQIYSDFPTYDALALDDFTVTSGELSLTNLTTLMAAANGFPAFNTVTGYRVSIFSSPAAAQNTLIGDIASLLILRENANVSQINGGPLGLVSLDVQIDLPNEGTYWLGIATVASTIQSGQFFLRDNGPNGLPFPGGNNGVLANPDQGFALGKIITANTDYAYQITAVPEPASSAIALVGLLACTRRRR
jgi:hypothetical protein